MADVHPGHAASTLWRRPSFLVSGVLIVLLLVVGGVVIVSNVVSHKPDSATKPPDGGQPVGPTPGQEVHSTSPTFTPSVCGLGPVETSGSVSRAPQATWTLVGTTAAPTVDGAGPGVTKADGLRYCFAQTPTGAVVAAANFLALGAVPAIFDEVVDHSVASGRGKDALKTSSPASSGGVRIQVMGFRLLSYDIGKTATVDIAMRTSRGALAGQVYDLIWDEGDWKMRVTDQGELLTQIVQLPDLQGYVPWSGA